MVHWVVRLFGIGFRDLPHAAISILDVLIVAFLIYQVMMLAKGTRAWQIIIGLLVFVALLSISSLLQLVALNWLLNQMFLLGPVAIVILFFPELRHALEEVGRLGYWGKGFSGLNKEDLSAMLNEIVDAADTFSSKKVGALIILERETGLGEFVENGTAINAVVSSELLGTIFYSGTPLHDGAVIIRRDRIVAAGCTLPLSESRDIGTTVHTRHKAALGITEQSDAVAVVVSEETGIISVAFAGKWVRGLRDEALRDRLMQEYLGTQRPNWHRKRSPRQQDVPGERKPGAKTPVTLSSLMPHLAQYNASRGSANAAADVVEPEPGAAVEE